MPMTTRLFKPLAYLMLAGVTSAVAQPTISNPVLMDILVFHGPDITGKEFVDVYLAVPYRSLQFHELDGRYAAQFTANITIRDSIGRNRTDTALSRSRVEDSYAITQGATGKAENIVVRFQLKPGTYRAEVGVRDQFSRREFTLTDTVRVPDLGATPAISSLMYVSQIEEHNQRYSITPYVGSTIWNGELQLFTFFEVYDVELPREAAFSWHIRSSDGRELGRGLGDVVRLTKRATQHFLPLRMTERALPGRYQLTVHMHPVRNGSADTTESLASSSRRYIVPRTLASDVSGDMTMAIKQLAYVASQAEIDDITAATTEAARRERFEQFWKKQDPTPNTVKNEAFEEYYNRIATANRLYKSYTEGWLTDMGRVYIIYGEPQSKEKGTASTGVTIVERWIYADNMVFVFEDNTGFQDFRLRTPLPPDAKYRYHR